VQLRSIYLGRWQDSAPAPTAFSGVGPVQTGRLGVTSPKRFAFLTADGQTATPLEQEALLGTNDLVEASFLDRCSIVTTCVGRLRFPTPGGRGFATGFLIAPGLVMTNHHVFPTEDAARAATIELDYRYNIAGQIRPTTEFELQAGEFFVADQALDFAVVAVAPMSTTGTDLAQRGYLRLNPETGKVAKEDFVTIVQYPEGDPMQIALRENEVIDDSQQDVIWYRADTAHGSSGAPVFNDSFQIAALHSSGRIKRNERGEFALRRGGWSPTLDGLTESDVVWEANVGVRVSRICQQLMILAGDRSPAHARVLTAAMAGGDVVATTIARLKSGSNEAESRRGIPVMDNVTNAGAPRAVSSGGSAIVVPLQLRISFEPLGAPGAVVVGTPAVVSTPLPGLQQEAFEMRIPVIYDDLEGRVGFNRKFLDLANNKDVPMPKLTAQGETVAAPLIGGGGKEIKYHKFSVWLQKDRRLALFTASNVDWRARKKIVDGKKIDRDTLAGFPPDSLIAEQWVSDPRVAAQHQLPDLFYTEDRGAFDKGHLVRRDDVCWGATFEDIQKGNGDTYHVTNCSPQTKPFNQGKAGEENWGDLESHVQKATKKDMEKVVIYAGPVFGADDRWFSGKDDSGSVRVQVPNRFWKIVVTNDASGPKAYGFVLEQNVRAVTEREFFVTDEWIGSMKRLSDIEASLRGWISLGELKPFDQFDAVHG
jgi:endonuclease G, mitochondrial